VASIYYTLLNGIILLDCTALLIVAETKCVQVFHITQTPRR